MTRKKCNKQSCNNWGRNKGRNASGKTIYDTVCWKHHKIKSKGKNYWRMGDTEKNPCFVCGWDKASCDRHRLDKNKGYIEGNVVCLCPNDHRLVTLGIIRL